MASAISASLLGSAGWEYESPVATYMTLRSGSSVGEAQMPAPDGPHRWTPVLVVLVRRASSTIG